jgi:hypothetical protein
MSQMHHMNQQCDPQVDFQIRKKLALFGLLLVSGLAAIVLFGYCGG